ncbi:MAG: VCBS repeat-containing protein [Phycisphaerae bacterium]|nr:VCBS repeat-containing protein [Phycisphaerae bacterium]
MRPNSTLPKILAALTAVTLALMVAGCVDDTSSVTAGVSAAATFTGNLVLARTFTDGTAVTTVTYLDLGDGRGRRAFGVDFNADGKIDPVVAYGADQAVIQILLSQGDVGTTDFFSLTLDSKRDMRDLSDVAVGDIDGDGLLDIVGGAAEAVWYYRQPAEGPYYLRGWGNQDEEDTLYERIDASAAAVDDAAIQATVNQVAGGTINLDDYVVTVESNYTDVEIGDFDNDGWNDIAASRFFLIHLEPRPEAPVEPIDIYDGDVIVFLNPGGARDGHEWSSISAGKHERQERLDRDGASGLMAYDLDNDGDLDLVSAARNDNNAQVAWFENPLVAGTTYLSSDTFWQQWRVGSVRDAWSIDLADITGDGLVDIVASGSAQMQVILFEQPATGPKREYDWGTYPIVTYENFEPRDVLVVDIDLDGRNELVVGATAGALRYFESTGNPRDEWAPALIADYDPVGDLGNLGYGDLDGDGDIDLVVVVSGTEENDARVTWVRNDLAR